MSMDSQEIILKSIKLADTCKVNGDLILNVKKTPRQTAPYSSPGKIEVSGRPKIPNWLENTFF